MQLLLKIFLYFRAICYYFISQVFHYKNFCSYFFFANSWNCNIFFYISLLFKGFMIIIKFYPLA
jgi:hypothetical protein